MNFFEIAAVRSINKTVNNSVVVMRNIMLWLPGVKHGTKQILKVLANYFVTFFKF